jgi:D-cysteine desulfhydrase
VAQGYLGGEPFPLTERFPELSAIARIALVDKPTAVEHFETLGREIGYCDLWIKRDDRCALPYGGNKPRKLEFQLAKVLANRCRSIITAGGIGTNHGLATAIYAKRLGLDTHLVLCEQPITEHVRTNLKLFHKFGATLHYAPGQFGVAWQVMLMLTRAKLALFKAPYGFIEPGGTSALGNLGFVNAACELALQIQQGVLATPSVIFCPAGSGGTMAGLVVGVRLCGLPTRVIGVSVTDRLFINRARIAHLANQTLALIGRYHPGTAGSPVVAEELTILDGYLGSGYGAVTDQAAHAVALAAQYGITLETTYSAKAFAALCQYAKEAPANSGPIVFWDTFNSHDLSAEAASVDYRDLPRAFHRFFQLTASPSLHLTILKE